MKRRGAAGLYGLVLAGCFNPPAGDGSTGTTGAATGEASAATGTSGGVTPTSEASAATTVEPGETATTTSETTTTPTSATTTSASEAGDTSTGERGATFTKAFELAVTGASSLAVGDFNGAGGLDLAVGSPSPANLQVLVLFDGDASKQSALDSGEVKSMATVDLDGPDGDTKDDLIVVENGAPAALGVYRNQEGGLAMMASLEGLGGCTAPTQVALGRVNGDTFVDAVVVCADVIDGVVYVPGAQGGWAPSESIMLGGPFVTAGLADVFEPESIAGLDLVALVGAGVAVFPGQGDGTYDLDNALSYGQAGALRLALGAIDDDAWADWVVIDPLAGECAVTLGGPAAPTQVGAHACGETAEDVQLAHVDADQFVDLVTLHIDRISISAGRGDGTFDAPHEVPIAGVVVERLAVADLDGDGRADLAYTGNGKVAVYLQDG